MESDGVRWSPMESDEERSPMESDEGRSPMESDGVRWSPMESDEGRRSPTMGCATPPRPSGMGGISHPRRQVFSTAYPRRRGERQAQPSGQPHRGDERGRRDPARPTAFGGGRPRASRVVDRR